MRRIGISYQEYKQAIIQEAHREMILEQLSETAGERKRHQRRIAKCEELMENIERMEARKLSTEAQLEATK